MEREKAWSRERVTYLLLVLFEYGLFSIFIFLFFNITAVVAVVGEPNATVGSLLEIGAAAPIINNITFFPDPISLSPNTTTTVNCSVEIYDSEGEDNLDAVYAEFFDTSVSSFGAADDNNNHYTNSSCEINVSYGDSFTALSNCLFEVEYYANPTTWNCTVNVTDDSGFEAIETNSTTIQELLAIGLPDSINYGIVNATEVSLENITNVTNFGNVIMNLSLEGYAQTEGDGLAMNCSLGSNGTIPIGYEKYNLTTSTPGVINLTQFEGNYTNLTSDSVVNQFELNYRQNDVSNDAINDSYWRIYLPLGVAGNCTGNIIFGAIQANGI